MVLNITNDEFPDEMGTKPLKRYVASVASSLDFLIDKQIDFFITPETMKFLERFKIDSGFLSDDPSEWNSNLNYKFCKELVRNLAVANDVGERGIKLISEYNDRLTR